MQLEEIAKLPFAMPHLDDPYTFIAERCRGRSVMNVGATGTVDRFFDGRSRRWLHDELGRCAARLVGVDIDAESIAYARARGVDNLLLADCTTMQLGERFDVIVISEVIEHVDAPGAAIRNLLLHLAAGGEILLTTPNPTYSIDVFKAMLGRAPAIYYDHLAAYFPENLATLCRRCGAQAVDGRFFSFTDDRPAYRRKSALIRAVGRLRPRLHSSYLLAIRQLDG